MDRKLCGEYLQNFGAYLHGEELSRGTIEKYCRDVAAFSGWLDGRSVTKEAAARWKEHLIRRPCAPRPS